MIKKIRNWATSLIAVGGLTLQAGLSARANAACTILDSRGHFAAVQADAISVLVSREQFCPKDVFVFRELLKRNGLRIETTMVANRGIHNPSQGSFSMFEMAAGLVVPTRQVLRDGDFFFGHFTAVDAQNNLTADQNAQVGSLMIEAFAWDPKKEFYNFYELRGNGREGQWVYRGDSADILADTQLLHRQPEPRQPQFGNRMRCSACHTGGGPVMKELAPPHNDWWTFPRGLDFGGRAPDASLAAILRSLVPAERLSKSVIAGLLKLEASKPFQKIKATLSLQEQLRPLFCPVEVNLSSDTTPNGKQGPVVIPSAFFIDPRLLPKENVSPIQMDRTVYGRILTELSSSFPETSFTDSDHAWLSPVKAASDTVSVQALISKGIIDQEFAADVLAVEMTNPVFSKERCDLLRALPNDASTPWSATFVENLKTLSSPAAKELVENLTNPNRNYAFHQKQVKTFFDHCQYKVSHYSKAKALFKVLLQRRLEIRASEISANPRGQILEPGFRVIFPETSFDARPGRFAITYDCEVREI